MPTQEKCRVLEHQKIGPQHYKLILVSNYIASHALPGQFVEVKCSENNMPLLRRPISLHRISKQHETFELVYEVVGKGTEQLSNYSVGEEVDVLGPLGTGFIIDPKKNINILVGGGMGMAPLLALAEDLKSRVDQTIYIMLGAKNKSHILGEEDYKKVTDQVAISTDDGSFGKKGFVSDLLLGLLGNTIPTSDFGLATVYACGPRPMLKAITEIASQKKIDCQLSMEERMACGIGACKGCAIMTKSGYKMVCKDGPVFDSREIVW